MKLVNQQSVALLGCCVCGALFGYSHVEFYFFIGLVAATSAFYLWQTRGDLEADRKRLMPAPERRTANFAFILFGLWGAYAVMLLVLSSPFYAAAYFLHRTSN
jgi:hypothetical protein